MKVGNYPDNGSKENLHSVLDEDRKSDDQVEKDSDVGDLVDDEFAENLGYTKADYDKGWEHRKQTMLSDENDKPYPFKVSIREFGNFGVGLHLYFKYLKFMTIGLAVMSIIMLPAFISN